MKVIVLGAGIFGVTAARELHRRGHRVCLIDEGALPHPLAASTDISKVVRLEYGADALYTEMAERALAGWRAWNLELGETLFHETGVAFLRRTPLADGTFEGDSYRLLRERNHPIERISGARFPAWNAARYPDGIFNRAGGFVESGRVVERLLALAQAEGIERLDERFLALDEHSVVTTRGKHAADCIVAALGSWTPHALPFTREWFRSSGMPVFHLRPDHPELFSAEHFPVFGADISNTGYYGFPLHAGVVKIANHGLGRIVDPSGERVVTAGEIAQLREFLADTFVSLADAPIVHTRVCVYCDTWDGHFWIDRDPERDDLVLATGGSGHAYKFAPLLGPLIADAVEGRTHQRFRWRPEVRPEKTEEAARRQ